ncbi:MAG: hypothetical protein KF864_08785 [Phycisphaeraceae bacterium]|nr:hypothetical protein [Phycisphaeraceae bacterium]
MHERVPGRDRTHFETLGKNMMNFKPSKVCQSVRRFAGMTAAAVVLLVGTARSLADIPAAMDRVPESISGAVFVHNLERAVANMNRLAALFPQEEGEEDGSPLTMAKKLLDTPGLNKSGSLAVALFPGEGEMGGPPAVMLVPVSDYAAFATALGAAGTDGVQTVNIDGAENFIKNCDGFAALSNQRDLVEGFAGKPGNAEKHRAMLGPVGQRVCDSSDVMIIGNVTNLRDALTEGAEQFKNQAEQALMMAGPQGAGAMEGMKVVEALLEGFKRDGSAGVLGISMTDKGLVIDIGSQFKAGSEVAGFFSSKGNSGTLLGRIPNQPFYFAGAVDLSAPGIRTMMSNATKMMGQDNNAGVASAMQNLDKMSGMAGVLGASPAAMMGGGVFVNSVLYTASNDSTSLLKASADQLTKLDGRKEGPVTTKVTYRGNAAEINGTKVDTWTMAMDFDPNDPMGMQAQMMTSMLFGQGGLSGMNAAVDGGVVTVYSQNTPLMTSALASARGGEGLAQNAILRDTQASLPADRTFEFYIGVKPLLDAFLGFAAMMGGAPEMKVPAQISPIALAGTTDSGGMTVRIFMPMDTMQTLADIARQMRDADDFDDDDFDDDGMGGSPRF